MNRLNGILKKADNNYKEDFNQLDVISSRGITDTSKSSCYCLASRYISSDSMNTSFTIRTVDSSATMQYDGSVCNVAYGEPDGFEDIGVQKFGFRPVFNLKSNIKIDNSNGKDGKTPDTAYELL